MPLSLESLLVPPGKAHRLKEAKEEAAMEIEEYRTQREAQFQEQQKKFAGSKDDFTVQMREESDQKRLEIVSGVEQNKAVVIDRLLEMVYDIKPELHKNINTLK